MRTSFATHRKTTKNISHIYFRYFEYTLKDFKYLLLYKSLLQIKIHLELRPPNRRYRQTETLEVQNAEQWKGNNFTKPIYFFKTEDANSGMLTIQTKCYSH